MKTPEEWAGEACTEMQQRFQGKDWTRDLPSHIRVMLGSNDFRTPLWQTRAMPPDGRIFKLDRFEDYLMRPFREGLGFKSWWVIHAALETQGKGGAQAIAMIRNAVPGYDTKVECDHHRTLTENLRGGWTGDSCRARTWQENRD